MKKTLLSLGTCLIAFLGTSQTQLFFEDFEGTSSFSLNTNDMSGQVGSAGDNEWTINNIYMGGTGTTTICLAGTSFTIGNVDDQSAYSITSPNGNYMHVLSDEAAIAGINNANYSPADGTLCFFAQSHFSKMTNGVSTTGYNNVTLEFWWLGAGSTAALLELYYSIDGGVTWVQQGGAYSSQTTWTQESITNAAWDGVSDLRFAYRFNNGQILAGADPGYSIDDIEITGTTSGCSDSFSSPTASACVSYTVPSGDETYTAGGTYTVMDTIANFAGCDSIMTIALTLDTVDVGVTDNLDGTATADAGGTATYQWLDCDNANAPVAGATSQTFAPTASGNYSCEVTDNGCVDTSACLNINVGSIGGLESKLEVYPNPTNGEFTIEFGNYTSEIDLIITDMSGQIIYRRDAFIPQDKENLNLNVAPGVYLLNIKQLGTDIIRKVRITIE